MSANPSSTASKKRASYTCQVVLIGRYNLANGSYSFYRSTFRKCRGRGPSSANANALESSAVPSITANRAQAAPESPNNGLLDKPQRIDRFVDRCLAVLLRGISTSKQSRSRPDTCLREKSHRIGQRDIFPTL
jgi:hypothetical protein